MTSLSFPKEIAIKPLADAPNCAITVPGSKSITNRALILASLCATLPGHEDNHPNYMSVLTNALESEDTLVMVQALQKLGISVHCNWNSRQIGVKPTAGNIKAEQADLFLANSGTSIRFLTALVCLGKGTFRLDGIARMRERPIKDLLTALAQLGVDIKSENQNGCPPVIVNANGLSGGTISVRGDVSSQYLSALLMVAPLAKSDVRITIEGDLVSWPYVDMTMRMMRQFGVEVHCKDKREFHIPGNQKYRAQTFAIEPDASSASYFAAAAAICGGRVQLQGLNYDDSCQGDVRFVDLLEKMGCEIERGMDGVTVHGKYLRGIDVDMNDISDTVMTLGVVALFAQGPTTIRNVAHIRHKETDRLKALAEELRRLGADVDEQADGLTIKPSRLDGTLVQTYNDHRMAMSLSLVGLRVPEVVIDNPGCVQKTYPTFFEDLEKLRTIEQ